MFKPGDLVISISHLCNALGNWDGKTYPDLAPHYDGCMDAREVGMIVAVHTKPIRYYRVLFGNKMMNINSRCPNRLLKKYEG
jgi:hypothetical protein